MNFDPVARSYHWLERLAFGGALQRCRTALLEQVDEARHVLILGEGDGRFLEAFLKRNSVATVTVIDSSAQMIALTRERVRGNQQVACYCEDLREIDLDGHTFDLIVTNFFLDCFGESDARRVVRQVRARLSVDGRWLWSDFAIPSVGLMKVPAACVVWGLYRFFRLTTGLEATRLVNVEKIFEEMGLMRSTERMFLGGLLRTELWECRADWIGTGEESVR